MIGNIKYDEYNSIINELETSNDNLKKIINYYNEKIVSKSQSIKMSRFTKEIENYIEYLKSTYKINTDADKVIEALRQSSF